MTRTGKRPCAGQDLTKAKRSKPSRAGCASTHTEDVPDSEEDPGHSASWEFLASAKEPAKKSNSAIANHSSVVEEQTRRLRKSLDDKAREITERESRLRAFLTSLLPDNRCSKPVKGKPKYEPALNVESIGPIINGNARAAVCSARELITQYQEVCKQVAVGERAVRSVSDWDGDCQALERILQRQGQKAKAEVFHVLQHQVKDSDEQMVGEADHDLWTRYALTSMEQRKHATDSWNGWAATAKYAQKGIHRMVKDLPGDID